MTKLKRMHLSPLVRFLAIAVLSAVVICCFIGQIFALEIKLPEKLPPHPRIFLTSQRQSEIETLRKSDAFLDQQINELVSKADAILAEYKKEGTTKYVLPDGIRLLLQSWRVLERTTVWGFAYRMTGKREYADAAIDEMLAVCRFKDWHPVHFLDTAEMSLAIALGYDWLYDVLSEDQRKEIRSGLVRLGLEAGLKDYEKGTHWVVRSNNWNEVCNAGMLITAMVVADEEPTIANKIVKWASETIPSGLAVYAPEGTYPEGPHYWNYGCQFSCLTLAALLDVCGDDFGLLATPGLRTTGDYFMAMVRPDFTYFNYSDSPEEAIPCPALFFFARVFDRPDYSAWLCDFVRRKNFYQIWERDSREKDEFFRFYDRLAVLRAVWYVPPSENTVAQTPLVKHFTGKQDVAVMRTNWRDPNAAFVGFKAGSNQAGHCHMDIGSFVYDVNGERWGIDLGRDMAAYRRPGDVWRFFRKNNRGHNTLLIEDKLQNLKADCKIVGIESEDDHFVARAVADITDAYSEQLESAIRSATLNKDGSLVIEDHIEGATGKVRWTMFTPAKIVVDGKTATLVQGGKRLRVVLESDEVDCFVALPATAPLDYEEQNEGFSILAAFAELKEGKIAVKVTFKPEATDKEPGTKRTRAVPER